MKQIQIAQVPENIGPPFTGIGNLGSNPADAPAVFTKVISSAIGLMTMVAAIIFIFKIISGAISWMGAGGDKGAIEDARKSITNGLVGLVIVIAATFIVELIGSLLGFDLILNPAELINSISI